MAQLFGIDVSIWQGDFDFNKAKSEGVKFVIIKAGGADGGLYKDPKFEQNYQRAKAAGLGVGAYFFSNATSTDAAKREAAFFKDAIKGKQFDYPVFCDAETSTMQALGKRALTSVISTFCGTMESYGYWCGFYTNSNWYYNYLDGKSLSTRYSLWLACWDTSKPNIAELQMWQFGGSTNYIRTNTVAGVVCDQNYCYVDYPSLIKAKGLNGYKKTATTTTPVTTTPTTSKPVTTKPATTTTPALKVGDKVKLASNATIYGSNARFAGFVYNMPFYVREINGNRVVFAPAMQGGITGAVHSKYLTKV